MLLRGIRTFPFSLSDDDSVDSDKAFGRTPRDCNLDFNHSTNRAHNEPLLPIEPPETTFNAKPQSHSASATSINTACTSTTAFAALSESEVRATITATTVMALAVTLCAASSSVSYGRRHSTAMTINPLTTARRMATVLQRVASSKSRPDNTLANSGARNNGTPPRLPRQTAPHSARTMCPKLMPCCASILPFHVRPNSSRSNFVSGSPVLSLHLSQPNCFCPNTLLRLNRTRHNATAERLSYEARDRKSNTPSHSVAHCSARGRQKGRQRKYNDREICRCGNRRQWWRFTCHCACNGLDGDTQFQDQPALPQIAPTANCRRLSSHKSVAQCPLRWAAGPVEGSSALHRHRQRLQYFEVAASQSTSHCVTTADAMPLPLAELVKYLAPSCAA